MPSSAPAPVGRLPAWNASSGSCATASRRVEAGRKQLPISQIAYRLGFTDVANFSRAFRRTHGISPSDYREGAEANRSCRSRVSTPSAIEMRIRPQRIVRCVAGGWHMARRRAQAFSTPKISLNIDFASPNNMRLLSL
ncbi:helix-turn-helix domain-containing protein [Burkholderia ubonensis]|uniref:helix-turn-helix domain-containing protein n=1 Tax=Burkholderia ubonensis TaxID=101571 RepID=UPI0022B762A0|nr:helix-turn-helix domain-containing protein [Burkholderia ubonensis]